MNNLTKSDLIDLVADRADLTKKDTANAVNTLLEVITEEVSSGNSVIITGFVKFTPKVRPARTTRNPQTGGTMDVPAKQVVSIRAGKALKDAVARVDVVS